MPKNNYAVIDNLEPGYAYQVRVVTKSDLGESMSLVGEVVAGADPGEYFIMASTGSQFHNLKSISQRLGLIYGQGNL